MDLLFKRMLHAAKFDVQLYEEVEAEPTALNQAFIVVILSSFAAGLGTLVGAGFGGVFWGTLASLLSWVLWAFFTCLIGTKLLPEVETKSDMGELLRTIGFASSPGVIRVFGLVPGIGQIVFPIASIWMLTTMIIAVRQALDYKSTLRAVVVCALGWMIQFALLLGLFYMVGTFTSA